MTSYILSRRYNHQLKYDVISDRYIAPWITTRWLVLSSLLWIGPSIYAYVNNLHSYAFLLVVTSLVSVNYWRKATYSWRRNIDLFVAKIAVSVFVLTGIYYIKTVSYFIIGYGGLIGLLYCYYRSNKLYQLQNPSWYKYHMAFHTIMTYEEIIILNSILDSRYDNNTTTIY